MKLRIVTLMIAICLASPVFAKLPKMDGDTTRQEPPVRPCFTQLDSNSDGYLSLEELDAVPHPHIDSATLFEQMDTDADDKVSQSEFENFKPAKGPSFIKLDSNADGLISYSEFSAHPTPHGDTQTIFNSIDTDGSNTITQAEFDAHLQNMPKRGNDKQKQPNQKATQGACHD